MKITFMTGLLLGYLTIMCASCSPEIDLQNTENNTKVENMDSNKDNDNNNRNDIVGSGFFTAQSTVGDVINDPAFGNFGHLLFPVDRNIYLSMTLA